MTAPLYPDVAAYSYALFGALVAVGVDERQAIDCARNVATSLALMPELSVLHVVHERLGLQAEFGYTGGRVDRWRAAQACTKVARFIDANPLGAEADTPAERRDKARASRAVDLHARFTSLPADERAGTPGFRKLATMNGGGR